MLQNLYLSLVGLLVLVTLSGVQAQSLSREMTLPMALNAVALSQVPLWAEACEPSGASNQIITDQGTFLVCQSKDQATIKYFPVSSGPVLSTSGQVLATFESIEHSPYKTRVIYTGNWCAEIGLKAGSSCYQRVTGEVANSFLPQWGNLSVTESMVSQFILDNFSPFTVSTKGIPSRCFSDTGEFVTTGLASDRSLLALTQRVYKYAGCDNSEGNVRFWANVMWFWPKFFGAMLIGTGITLASIFAGWGCCACCLV